MNIETMKLFDGFNTPIIATDKDKNVRYKNISAKKNIPSPRLNANIDRYLVKHAVVFVTNQSVRIETVKRAHFYRRAVVTSSGEYEIWIFCTGLQYYLPDEVFFADRADINKLVNMLEKNACDEGEQNGVLRYDRLCEYLGKIISALETGLISDPYNLVDITRIIHDFTESALSKYNRRFGFESFVLNSSPTLSIDNLGFVNIYINLLSMMLRMAAPREINIKMFIRANRLVVEFIGFARLSMKNNPCEGIQKIFELFPAEIINCAYIKKFAQLYGSEIDFSIAEGMLKLKFDISIKQDIRLHSSNLIFSHEKEIADKFMSALSEIVL